MHEIFLTAFATFFATIGPLDVAVVFASLTGDQSPKERTSSALKGFLIGTGILFIFVLFGEAVLNLFGISLAALRIGGGVLLMLIAIDLVFARSSGASSTTQDETKEAEAKSDISIFPLATPLIAGPGAMGAVVLLMADADGNLIDTAMVIGGLVAVLVMTLVCMLLASQIQKVLGQIGVHVIARVFGVILAALAAQFVLDGLAQSPLFAK
ncbi:MarC family protein [Kiloniella sp.]|uniref:MarC family protein n=1 Tax=Kiloniella sp. TaxID=1938587 RepID=UPI003B013197